MSYRMLIYTLNWTRPINEVRSSSIYGNSLMPLIITKIVDIDISPMHTIITPPMY